MSQPAPDDLGINADISAQVPHWSRVGRLKRTKLPNLSGGGHVFGGGASQGIMTVLAGRLLCDTYLAARELVKEVDYTLKTLSHSLLQQERHELSAADVPGQPLDLHASCVVLGQIPSPNAAMLMSLAGNFLIGRSLRHAVADLSGCVQTATIWPTSTITCRLQTHGCSLAQQVNESLCLGYHCSTLQSAILGSALNEAIALIASMMAFLVMFVFLICLEFPLQVSMRPR